MNNIRYLQRIDIDEDAWNRCIDTADNGLIYAYTYYLDVMCSAWDALVLNDYEAVMPLPWRKKWGISYLYQPFFTPVLGIFGKDLFEMQQESFLKMIPKKFMYWDIDLNENIQYNNAKIDTTNLQVINRINFLLNISGEYQDVFKSYSRLAKRKLIKAEHYQLQVERGAPIGDIISLYRKHYDLAHKEVPDDAYKSILRLTNCLQKENFITYKAKTGTGEVVAFYLLLTDTRWVYSLLGGSSPKGKEMGAFYFLTDIAINNLAGNGKVFRFEGSDIPGIAFFNQQFGPRATNYLHLKKNNLPWPLRLLKS
jgi:hypothetical protein